MPSFHPETLLRACRHADKTVFRFVTLTENLWYSESPTVGRRQEIAEASLEATQQFWEAIAALAPPTIEVEEVMGCDGMTVATVHTLGDITTSFEVWCPTPESPAGKFVTLIYELAWELLEDRGSIERLEQLHGYLSLDLPARMNHGEIKTVRFFGGLASHHEDELRRLLAAIPRGTPLVLDMTNCRGMVTILYPVFVEFATQHPIIGWAASASARRQIEEMPLVEPHVFDTVLAAEESVRRETGGHRQEGSSP